jgi:hypothetical protein
VIARVPLPFALPQDEFEAATAWLAQRGRVDAVRVLRKVSVDENHLVPPGLVAAAGRGESIEAYTLLSREDDIPRLGRSSKRSCEFGLQACSGDAPAGRLGGR